MLAGLRWLYKLGALGRRSFCTVSAHSCAPLVSRAPGQFANSAHHLPRFGGRFEFIFAPGVNLQVRSKRRCQKGHQILRSWDVSISVRLPEKRVRNGASQRVKLSRLMFGSFYLTSTDWCLISSELVGNKRSFAPQKRFLWIQPPSFLTKQSTEKGVDVGMSLFTPKATRPSSGLMKRALRVRVRACVRAKHGIW